MLDVVADSSGLEPGDYEAVIVLGGTGREVTVQLTVAPAGDPSLSVFPTKLSLEAEAGAPVTALALARLMGAAGSVGPRSSRARIGSRSRRASPRWGATTRPC
ncbi:MAG: hypothetical protein R2748_00325 [Bryobacterales bacterium]